MQTIETAAPAPALSRPRGATASTPLLGRVLGFAYGATVYTLFLGTFLYAIGFVSGFVVPRGIDDGTPGTGLAAWAINLGLLGLFAVQHAVMARPAFKARWTKIVPRAVERSTFVLATCICLNLMYWNWVALPDLVWSVESSAGAAALWALSGLGWTIVLLSTFMIDHFELFGIKQAWYLLRGRELPEARFHTPAFYKWVRHPIYVGFLLAFWSTPVMSVGHLLFAIGTTGYILIGIQMEEHDLIGLFGEKYREYKRRVPMLLPRPARND